MSKASSKKSATHPMQDYKSRVSDPASRKFETFSYIPRMDDKAIRRQVQYLISRGWIPAIGYIGGIATLSALLTIFRHGPNL